MLVITWVSSKFCELRSLEYPAPLCTNGHGPMWLSRRVFGGAPARTSIRLGFVCPACGDEFPLRNQEQVPVTDDQPF
jgi:hypothetical protein